MKLTVQQALVLYHEEMVSLGLAPGTVRLRESHLRRFADACDQVKREMSGGRRAACMTEQLTPVHVARFFTGLSGAQGDRNNALTAVRGFIRYLERSRYIETGAAGQLLGERKSKPAPRKPKHYIPVEQFSEALEVAAGHHPEDRAVVALALYTLARQSEILGLRLENLRLRDREIVMRRQKTKDYLSITISPDLAGELSWWLSWYASHTGYDSPVAMMTANPGWYLVPRRKYTAGGGDSSKFSVSGASFTLRPEVPGTQLERVIKRVLTGLGVEVEDGLVVRHKGEGIHTIRRSGARALLDYLALEVGEDKALLRVSTMLGHANTQMTLTYIGRDIERKQLNDWLMDNPMYGARQSPRSPTGGGNLVTIKRERSDGVLRPGDGSAVPLHSLPSDVRRADVV
jgi:integrase